MLAKLMNAFAPPPRGQWKMAMSNELGDRAGPKRNLISEVTYFCEKLAKLTSAPAQGPRSASNNYSPSGDNKTEYCKKSSANTMGGSPFSPTWSPTKAANPPWSNAMVQVPFAGKTRRSKDRALLTI